MSYLLWKEGAALLPDTIRPFSILHSQAHTAFRKNRLTAGLLVKVLKERICTIFDLLDFVPSPIVVIFLVHASFPTPLILFSPLIVPLISRPGESHRA